MFGWRGRIGLMLPARNQVMEPDLNQNAPAGISIHGTRMRRDKDVSDVNTNTGMLNYAGDASDLLAQAGVDISILGCTAASFLGGPGEDLELSRKLEERTGVPTITASTAVVDALKVLGSKRITIITPYIDEINKREIVFFEGNGFEILNIKGMEIIQNSNLPKVMPGDIYHFCKDNFVPHCDAVFISCTNFRAMEVIPYLEKDLGKPVVTSNQASLWKALKLLNIGDKLPNCGELLNNY